MDAISTEIRRRRDEETRIRKEIEELNLRLHKLHDEALALERAASILGLKPVSTVNGDTTFYTPQRPLVPVIKGPPRVGADRSHFFKWGKPLPDFAKEILEQAEGPLHISEIYERLLALEPIRERIMKLGGSRPSWESLDSAIRKDPKKRFKLVDTRTYDLAKQEEIKSDSAD